MQLKPGLSASQAYEMLAASARIAWGESDAAELEKQLKDIAAAMAKIGAIDVPDDTEPLFGGEDVPRLAEMVP
jgi:hypothetical protein